MQGYNYDKRLESRRYHPKRRTSRINGSQNIQRNEINGLIRNCLWNFQQIAHLTYLKGIISISIRQCQTKYRTTHRPTRSTTKNVTLSTYRLDMEEENVKKIEVKTYKDKVPNQQKQKTGENKPQTVNLGNHDFSHLV